ncbi:MAG TPA: serine hydrolase domain-containing protein [Bdellovibrionales bacterium]|nr:serine hydrolase domain-containing protein [Bdellovibrionales bacterium]
MFETTRSKLHETNSRRPRLVEREFDPKRLANLHNALLRHVENGHTPGLVAYVYHRGREVIDTIGTTAFEGREPMRRNTIFRLASTTKPITAVGAMVLVEECRLRLDDPVDEWLPELKNRRVLRTLESAIDDTVPAARAITVRDLLTFKSGYGEVAFISPTCAYQRAMAEARLPLSHWPFAGSNDEFMKRLGELPLAFQPGERWLYHMSGEILGVLLARVTGKTLGRFLSSRIFEPLGMKDTGFFVPREQLGRLPVCYASDLMTGQRFVIHEAGQGYAASPPPFESGAGGLVSTVDDLAAFGHMMLNGGVLGGERILSRPTIELMATDQLTDAQKAVSPFFPGFWEDHGWGFGLGVVTKRNDVGGTPGRFGWEGAFGTSWFVDPHEDMVGVMLTQRTPASLAIAPLWKDFWTSAYQLVDD